METGFISLSSFTIKIDSCMIILARKFFSWYRWFWK